METLFSNLNQDATNQLGTYSFIFDNAIGGGFCLIIILVLLRCTARALIYSWFGRQGGALISSLIEGVIVTFTLAAAWRNPGVLLASLTWGCLIFKSLIHGL